MKTERRHELQQNELAHWLEKQIKNLQPYSKAIIAGLLLTFALLFALYGMKGNQKQTDSLSWNEYMMAAGETDLEGLREIVDRYPRSPAAAWGLQSAGDIGLATGSRNMFLDRGQAIEELKQARDDYQAAYNLADSDMLRQRSLMGLAQTHEALNEFDEAEAKYQKVIDDWPDSALAETASNRIAYLNQTSTREFYDWFMKQSPKPLGLPEKSVLDDALDLGSDVDLTPPESALDSAEESVSSDAESSILDDLPVVEETTPSP